MIKICLLGAAFIGIICFSIALKNADDNAEDHKE
jgi:hypothetical protein